MWNQSKISTWDFQFVGHDMNHLTASDENVLPAKLIAQKSDNSWVMHELIDIKFSPHGPCDFLVPIDIMPM